MANVYRPNGLNPVSYLNGAPWTGGGRVYYIASTDNNAFAIGDPVVLSGSGDGAGVPGVTLATAGTTNLVTGSMLGMGGVKYGSGFVDPAQLDSIVIPASKTKAYYILVADDPNTVFEIAEGNSGTPFTAAEIGLNCSLLAGTNNGYTSGWILDNTTEATTAALQMKLLGLAQRNDNAFGLGARWLTLINNHSYRTGVAGA